MELNNCWGLLSVTEDILGFTFREKAHSNQKTAVKFHLLVVERRQILSVIVHVLFQRVFNGLKPFIKIPAISKIDHLRCFNVIKLLVVKARHWV